MSVTSNSVYTKNGAVFATAREAQIDKNALFSSELRQSIKDCFAQMLSDGVLLEPVYPVWDQATFTLTIVAVSSSLEAYNAATTFDVAQIIADSEASGWTFVQKFIS